MAIEGINALSGLKSTERVASERKAAKKSETESKPSADSVDINSNGISKFAEKLESVPDVRESKIAELQEQIANGAYKVPSEQLAEIILDELA
jgi:negative regulator of flagellin synthesis FlgM